MKQFIEFVLLTPVVVLWSLFDGDLRDELIDHQI